VSEEAIRRRRLSRRRAAQRAISPDGRMTLVEHLRELRNRLGWALLGMLVGTGIAWFFYGRIFNFLEHPFNEAIKGFPAANRPKLTVTGISDAFNLQLQVSFAAGVILASPVWLYQLFRFVTPGLRQNERKYGGLFVLSALPLFLGGVAAAYYSLPHVLGAFLGFARPGLFVQIPIAAYMSFLLQIMVVFGIGCIAPVVIVVLNAIGILSARRYASWWRWVIFLTLVFAAFATPTGDPVNMALFAAPLLLLMLFAFVICWNTDRRRAKREGLDGLADLDDDETSPLHVTRDVSDDLPSEIARIDPIDD
jgi:sec-independent protein translocase protein TatC